MHGTKRARVVPSQDDHPLQELVATDFGGIQSGPQDEKSGGRTGFRRMPQAGNQGEWYPERSFPSGDTSKTPAPRSHLFGLTLTSVQVAPLRKITHLPVAPALLALYALPLEAAQMAYRTLLAVCTTGSLLLLPGCAALGLLSGAASMDAQPGNPRSGSPQPLPGGPSPAGHSIFEVVGWGMAIVLGALVLAFVARLLNGRTPNRLAPAGAMEPIPETTATRGPEES